VGQFERFEKYSQLCEKSSRMKTDVQDERRHGNDYAGNNKPPFAALLSSK
jgi:hypothetical protein